MLLGPAILVACLLALVVTSVVAQKGRGTKRRPAAVKMSAVSKRVTPRQRENTQARIELAASIVQRYDAEAQARGLSAGWRRSTLETLLPLSLKALERVSQEAADLDSLAAATAAVGDDPNLLGDADEDLVFTPIAPCRFIDTRNYVAGAINGIREFDLDAAASTYGGSGVCGAAALGASGDAIGAIAANLTIVGPTSAPGFLAVKPTGASPLSSLLNWYDSGGLVQVANAGVFQTANGVFNFVIQTSGTTHVIMDILGAFIEPEATALQTQTVSSFIDVPDEGNTALLSPGCPAGWTLTGGGCGTDEVGHAIENTEPFDPAWFCYSNNQSGFDSVLVAYAVCTRVPGR
jgi:hypothetical protein